MNELNIRAASAVHAPELIQLRAHTHTRPLRAAVITSSLTTCNETVGQMLRHGIPGHQLDVIAADAASDAFAERRYDVAHLCCSGSEALAASAAAYAHGVPVAACCHAGAEAADHYRRCSAVLSPSLAADYELLALGVPLTRIHRWLPGVDTERFSPARYSPGALASQDPDGKRRLNVLHTGPLAPGAGLDLLIEGFLQAHDRDARLHLVIEGEGPLRDGLARRLGPETATFLGRLDRESLASVYASADLLVFAGDAAFGADAILEAQASGLPVLAVDAGAALELVQSGRSGCLVAPSAVMLGDALFGLARRERLRDQLATGGLMAVRERTWVRSLAQLADGWAVARGVQPADRGVAAEPSGAPRIMAA
jgi:glycosyltransferase involved in cell wall biosynthesis